jgi:hypothetical protein
MFKKFFNIINSKITLNLIIGVLISLIFRYVVYPGFNDSNIILNVTSSVITILILLFIYFYVRHNYENREDDFNKVYLNSFKEPETELDYHPSKMKKSNIRKKSNKTLI